MDFACLVFSSHVKYFAFPPKVLLDRRLDPITPLLNQWTYQAMVHELIGMNNNRVDLTGREEVPAEMQNLTLSGDSDEFYRLNMYANFGEIGEAIQKLVKNFQDKKGNMGGKLDSISDIKDFITNYPEFKKMSGTVSKHVALVTELWMTKYIIGEIFSSDGATLYKNPSDHTMIGNGQKIINRGNT